jgi:hypothetical protein
MAGDDIRNAFVFYNYKPAPAAAILFRVLSFITTIAHITKMMVKRTWYFSPFVLGCLCKSRRATTRAVEDWRIRPPTI